MREVKFTVDGVEGEFTCDADEVRSYKTAKQLSMADEDASLTFEIMERVFLGRDEEYVERLGGDVSQVQTLMTAAIGACGAKNTSASSRQSSGTEAK